MREQARGATWRLLHDRAQGKIVLVFEGRLSATEARTSADAFAEVLGSAPHDVVWDLRAMTGYDVLAPLAWQRVVRPWIRNIRSLGVLGGNTFVRLGATALAAALGIPMHDASTAHGR